MDNYTKTLIKRLEHLQTSNIHDKHTLIWGLNWFTSDRAKRYEKEGRFNYTIADKLKEKQKEAVEFLSKHVGK